MEDRRSKTPASASEPMAADVLTAHDAEVEARALEDATKAMPKWPQTRWTVKNWLLELAAEKRAES